MTTHVCKMILLFAGVYFTKYCRDRSTELNIVGWVKNSKRGTIVGKIQGEKSNIDKM